jgi:predicted deacylase
MSAPIYEMAELDLQALPPGEISRVRVELTRTGMGRKIEVPILVSRGTKPGPVVGITAAVHGNELNGIPVIHRLFQSLGNRKGAGTIVAVVVVNVPGLNRHQRAYLDGKDINGLFPGKKHGNSAQVYAHRFMNRVIRHFDFLLDLHTASFGRVNSLYVRADTSHAATARMAQLQKPQIILHNPPSDSTLRGAAMELGIPAITVEIADPHRFQPKYIRPTLAGVHAVLSDLGLTKKRERAPGPEPILCERSYWIYTDRGGLLEVLPGLAASVEKGEPIALLRNEFGDVVSEMVSPDSGVVIGKSVNPVAETGARVLHLGIRSKKGLPPIGPMARHG